MFTYILGFGVSVYAIAMVDYASMVFPGILPYAKIIEILLIVLFFAATIKGSKFIASLTSVMTIILLASIAVFVIMGLPKVQPGYFNGEGFFYNGAGGFFLGIAVMSFACSGTTLVPVSFMEVTKNPNWIFNIISVLAAFSALMVGATLFTTLSTREKITCICIIAICVFVSLIRLKTGAVKTEELIATREAITNRAIESEKENQE